jgi:hypothetical protein
VTQYASVGAAIDKAKLASAVTYIALLEIDILDSASGAVVETVRLTHNNENYVWRSNTYIAMPFEFEVNTSKGELPEIKLTLTDMTLAIHGKLEEARGATDSPVRLIVTSSASPDNAEVYESFTVVQANSDSGSYSIELILGAENPLTLRFPPRLMFRDRCFWKYRGPQCRYTGGLGSCDYSLTGPNGCRAHSNVANFGGFAGIRRRGYQ